MTIETKHNLTKTVWLMLDNKPIKSLIWSIEPVVNITHDRGSSTKIRYRLEEMGKLYDEYELFESKEELIKSL